MTPPPSLSASGTSAEPKEDKRDYEQERNVITKRDYEQERNVFMKKRQRQQQTKAAREKMGMGQAMELGNGLAGYAYHRGVPTGQR